MSKQFDITLKHLIEAYPRDWLALAGISTSCEVEIVDADLATVSAETDKLLLIHEQDPWLLNLELQASYKVDLPDRLFFGSTLATRRHGMPVQSVSILLRPEADGPAMNGRLLRSHPPGRDYLEFRYDVIRLWQLPVEQLVTGGLGILPLAPLAAGAEQKLEHLVAEMHEHFAALADPAEQGSLWAASFVLMGLRYSRETAQALFKGVSNMEESVTYQEIVEKGLAKGLEKGLALGKAQGRIEAARDLLLDLGARQFGSPSAAVLQAIDAVSSYEQLKRLSERLAEVEGWEELLKATS